MRVCTGTVLLFFLLIRLLEHCYFQEVNVCTAVTWALTLQPTATAVAAVCAMLTVRLQLYCSNFGTVALSVSATS
jgi:hypothetical protein